MSTKELIISSLCLAMGLPAGAATIDYVSGTNTYYVGVEDRGLGGPATHTSDYDYNDLIFSLTSTDPVTLNGGLNSALYPPLVGVPPSTPPPFWNNNSFDGSGPTGQGLNYGQCLYNSPNDCGGPFAPTASYLATNDLFRNAIDFGFTPSATGTITLTLLSSITNDTTDATSLFWCPAGSTTGCTAIPAFVAGVTSFTPGQAFDLVLNNNGNFFDSNTGATGANAVTDAAFNHFAAAFPEAVGTPEPGTLAVVGGVLVGLGVLRRRQAQRR